MNSTRQFLKVLVRLVRQRRGRKALTELLDSFQAANEALEAGDVDQALELLDDDQAEALLADVLLEDDPEDKP